MFLKMELDTLVNGAKVSNTALESEPNTIILNYSTYKSNKTKNVF